MNCPRADGRLEPLAIGRVEADRCGTCEGIWYDRDEFRRLKDRESHGDYRWLDFDLWKEPSQIRAGDHDRYLCPKDGSVLASAAYGDTAIQIDVCRQCKGLWLDKGEYDAILRYLEERVDTQSAEGYRQDLAEEIREVFGGPEGPVSELRDVLKVMHLLQLRLVTRHPMLDAATRNVPPV